MIPLYTIAILGGILIQAFFMGTEMAFTSLSRIKLRGLVEEGDANARKLESFVEKQGKFLGTTLVGTNLAMVMTSALSTRVFAEYVGSELAPLLVTVVMVPVTLVFAEIIPKMIARQFPTEMALKTVRSLDGFYKAFNPLIISVNFIARTLLRPFGRHAEPWESTFTKSDLKKMLHLGHETGEVEADEVELIHKVLDFGAKKVEGIMVPLFRVASINAGDPVDNLKELVSVTGFSRIPVYTGNKNEITGIVNIYDILYAEDKDVTAGLKDFVREPVHVKTDDGLDIALTRLRHRKQPMGIVVDQEENAVGIVTIEDILEEIVGEIEDRG